ncbi:MAG: tetratricopeptide repeat protein [candidate division KSB1 bacterium]
MWPVKRSAWNRNEPSLVATSLNNLALLLQSQGKYAEAEPLFRRALEIFEKSLGTDHPNTQTIRKNYALLLAEMK